MPHFSLLVTLLVAIATTSLVVSQTTDPVLLAQRINNAQVWMLRTNGADVSAIYIAYGLTAAANITHTIQDIGSFGPFLIAEEYDSLVYIAGELTGQPQPVQLPSNFDYSTCYWISTDILKCYHTVNYSTGYNATINGYNYVLDGERFVEYISFVPGSPLIDLGYSIQPPDAILANANASTLTPNTALCGIIMAACPVNTSFQQYDSFIDCLTFMDSIYPADICPYPFRSNTTTCRVLHAISALVNPYVHCPHVAVNSMVCVDSCLPNCSQCSSHGHCVATYPTLFNAVFTCQCNDGYSGDGFTCVPNSCTQSWQCPDRTGYSATCSNGLCGCKSTFVWDSTLGAYQSRSTCGCPSNSTLQWSNGQPYCLPSGKCREQWQCPQDYNSVKCVAYGTNTLSNLNSCICNPGFTGGWEFPCSCNGTVSWSSQISGNVCLQPGQCVANWQCPTGKTCVGANPIGSCA